MESSEPEINTTGSMAESTSDEMPASSNLSTTITPAQNVVAGLPASYTTVPTWDPLDYQVLVKPEFLLSVPKPSVWKRESASGSGGADDTGGAKQKGTKRPRDHRPNGMEKLCGQSRKGKPCSFGDSCRFSHDIAAYLSTKEPDVGDSCPEYTAFGYCTSGFSCRFGEGHIDRVNLINKRRPEEEGGVIERQYINALPKTLQTLLRKKNYVYSPPATTSPSVITSTPSALAEFNSTPLPDKPVKLVDFSNKVYIAPLTTIGNLPWRRVMKDLGADITCGEMAMVGNLQTGQPSEWALLRKHEAENCFGVQVACPQPDQMHRFASVLEHEVTADFVDLNCGCPIDVICNRGAGSKLMTRPSKLCEMLKVMGNQMPSKSVTVKIRTGWDDKSPNAHKLIPEFQKIRFKQGRHLSAIFIHGRSRLQRYTRLANWEYVLQAARAQDSALPLIPVIGNGDIFSYEDWASHRHLLREHCQDGEEHEFGAGLASCAMLGRGAIIKPWLPTEIHENRHWDISASERFDIYKNFCTYGLEHWGSDTQGINNTRRFLLEWLSFTHRYVPVGLLERPPQRLFQKPPSYRGREDLETLLSSPHAEDWVEIARRLLGPLPEGFQFVPKHKSNSYATPPVVA